MKKLHLLIFLLAVLVVGSCFMGSLCPPDDAKPPYVNVIFKEELDATGSVDPLYKESEFSLSENDDFKNNVNASKSIVFSRLSFKTNSCSPGLHSSRFYVTFYGHDLATVIWEAIIDDWQAESYINNAYEIMLTQQQKNDFDAALADYKEKNNFKISLEIEGVDDNDGAPFTLNGKVELVFKLNLE